MKSHQRPKLNSQRHYLKAREKSLIQACKLRNDTGAWRISSFMTLRIEITWPMTKYWVMYVHRRANCYTAIEVHTLSGILIMLSDYRF